MPSRKGSPNRNKNFLMSRLQDMYGSDFHPILRLADNAVRLDEMAKESNDVTAIRAVQRKVFSGADTDTDSTDTE